MSRKLYVYLNQKSVGDLFENHGNFFEFHYKENAKPISLTMPYQLEPYKDRIAKPFFENLLPEGEILKVISKIHHVSEHNPFSILNVIGEDVSGAISLSPELIEEKVEINKTQITSDDFSEMLDLYNRGIPYYKKNMRYSVAGVQNKTTVIVDENKMFYPNYYYPSTHILKFDNIHVNNILENELFCTLLAKSLGFKTSEMTLENNNNISYLKIKRFDRVKQDNIIKRISQEDFMQLSSMNSNRKYQSEGGPSFKRIIELIDKYVTNPNITKINIAKIMIYNYLIGNGDYHAKNFSVLVDKEVYLTPLYDLVSTSVYDDLDTNIAMYINKKRDYVNVTKKDLIEEINSWNLDGNKLFNLIVNDFKNIVNNAKEISQLQQFSNSKPLINKLINLIDENLKKIM